MKKKATGICHGKIILIGEHSVVYGNPAIALPIKASSVRVSIEKRDKGIYINSVLYKGFIEDAPNYMENVSSLINKIILEFEISNPSITIDIESDLEIRRGMGSSAAVVCAITKAISSYYDRELSYEKSLELCDYAENIAHGKSSGIDARASISNEAILFSKKENIRKINLDLDAYLLIADTKTQGQTKKAVLHIASNYKNNKNLIENLNTLSNIAIDAISKKDINKLGKAMYDYHKTLATLGVSSTKLDDFVETSIKSNSLGAKLSGGGLGGVMIALFKEKEDAISLRQKLINKGAGRTWIQALRKTHS